ncbi:MAG: aminoacyl-tRNA hydrolase [Solobacterium sp.]|jgi:PTH1 family peptidyl-tRNA hydrolase|nr:aminoacyl-tRNA hydrolase [Solobacterium sp.]
MKLIVGLGNPGKEYAGTRHNSGFMAMDRLAEKCGVSLTSSKWNALIGKTVIQGQQVLLMKPLTYMNLSGQAVSQAVHYYHIDPQDILVIHDDMDLTTGSVRIRAKGSSGGQKGMKSIQQSLGTNDIARIRIGVGHSRHGDHEVVPDWVLSPVPKAQREVFETALNAAADAAYSWVNESIDAVMNRYTIRVKESEE